MANSLTFYDDTQTHSIKLNIPTPTGTDVVTLPESGTVGTTADIATAKQEAIEAGLGVGQTWQDVAASRALGVTYTNSTGKPIEVHVATHSGANADSYFYINGNIFARALSGSSAVASHYMIVPNGASYSIVSASGSISRWSELR